jgi:hypothetical protein
VVVCWGEPPQHLGDAAALELGGVVGQAAAGGPDLELIAFGGCDQLEGGGDPGAFEGGVPGRRTELPAFRSSWGLLDVRCALTWGEVAAAFTPSSAGDTGMTQEVGASVGLHGRSPPRALVVQSCQLTDRLGPVTGDTVRGLWPHLARLSRRSFGFGAELGDRGAESGAPRAWRRYRPNSLRRPTWPVSTPSATHPSPSATAGETSASDPVGDREPTAALNVGGQTASLATRPVNGAGSTSPRGHPTWWNPRGRTRDLRHRSPMTALRVVSVAGFWFACGRRLVQAGDRHDVGA